MSILSGQVAIVTGGGHGIGHAISVALGAAGAQVVVAGRRVSALDETVAEIRQAGGLASKCVVDVSERDQVEAMVESTLLVHGQIDLLVNNAGRLHAFGPVWEADPDEWLLDVKTNLYGTFLCCRSVLPAMIARKTGKIINMSGGGASGALLYRSGYGASKAALVQFSESLNKEAAPHGIRVYVMGPGLVLTEITKTHVDIPYVRNLLPEFEQRFASGQHVPPTLAAELVVFLASPEGDPLAGRFISATEDYREVARRVDEVVERDLYVNRRRTLKG
jgi:NAD(P)-dependent dehydrogenase (short-subunit alcohol dehydrogenase family)